MSSGAPSQQVQLPTGSPAVSNALRFQQSVPSARLSQKSIWDAAEINRSTPVVDPNTDDVTS